MTMVTMIVVGDGKIYDDDGNEDDRGEAESGGRRR